MQQDFSSLQAVYHHLLQPQWKPPSGSREKSSSVDQNSKDSRCHEADHAGTARRSFDTADLDHQKDGDKQDSDGGGGGDADILSNEQMRLRYNKGLSDSLAGASSSPVPSKEGEEGEGWQ